MREPSRRDDKGTDDGVWSLGRPARGRSASGRGRSRPTTRDGSRSPASAAASTSTSTSATSRYARQDLDVDSDATAASSKEITLALQPARIIEGRVLAADTGQPIPDAVVSAATSVQNEHASGVLHHQVPRRRPGPVPA